jgi:hypothetical protein
MNAAWPTLVSGVGYFSIGWDSNGNCTGVNFAD